ncbi:unnamed protein product [Brachionus calyciflorus]|uniref:Uncharacterized protein n=1 Tax=Brachionus calyciflorus TaxID=104777 RepID=A0A814PQZ4_9BILA|nr:unnamed protein product [Brachionus calyciflorus]
MTRLLPSEPILKIDSNLSNEENDEDTESEIEFPKKKKTIIQRKGSPGVSDSKRKKIDEAENDTTECQKNGQEDGDDDAEDFDLL